MTIKNGSPCNTPRGEKGRFDMKTKIALIALGFAYPSKLAVSSLSLSIEV